ncbi:uncharacterized protein [Dermacentor albipictus]|uniref:uncharacterized protein isoform X2 n=1 Tax=Dermacentor albipictus TaxID=60249 RepID=UPI0038FC296C
MRYAISFYFKSRSAESVICFSSFWALSAHAREFDIAQWRIHTRPVNNETSGMAEETSNEYTPRAFSFTDEASTSRDNIQGASPALGAYPTISYDARRYQWNTQHRPLTDETYTTDGVTANASTSSLLLGSSTSIDHGRPSTSRAGMEQATAILEDGARLPETSSVGQWNTQYHMVDGTSSVAGHTDNAEDGSTGFRRPVYSSSSGSADDAVASTISAGIEKASGVLGNEAGNATGTGGRVGRCLWQCFQRTGCPTRVPPRTHRRHSQIL